MRGHVKRLSGRRRYAEDNPKFSPLYYPAQMIILAAAYFGAAKLGLTLSFYQGNVTLVWPPTGIALAAILLFGYRPSLDRVRDILGWVLPGAAVGALVSATNGIAWLCLTGAATWAAFCKKIVERHGGGHEQPVAGFKRQLYLCG